MNLLFMIIYLLLLIITQSQTYTLLTMQSTLERYSSLSVLLHNHLLPENTTFTLLIEEADASLANSTINKVYQISVENTKDHMEYQIWNYQNNTRTISISLKAQIQISLSSTLLYLTTEQQENLFTAIIDDTQTSGYILPFNMLNVEVSKVFVLRKEAPLTSSSYSLPPFMSTYWTQNKITASAIPWIPFFSHCTSQQPYIILNDLLLPQDCQPDVYMNLKCQNKALSWNCLIQQFQLANVYQEYWFNAINSTLDITIEILFYLYPKQLTPDQLNILQTMTEGQYSQLFDHFSSQLIPVIYKRKSNDNIKVNVFNMIIRVDLNEGQFYQIISAEIQGHYDQTITSPQGKLNVDVQYINVIQQIIYYNTNIHSHLVVLILIAISMACLLKCVQNKVLRCNITDQIKFMISPAIKGTAYTLLTSGIVAVLIHTFSYYTNYSGILATYDTDYSGQTLRSNNKGRYGLALLFTGIMIVMTGIKQAFKVNQTQQLKIALEDDKWQFQSQEQLQKKIDFSKKSQISHRRFIFNGILMALLFSIEIFYLLIQSDNFKTCLFILLYPIFNKLFMHLLKRYLIESHIFICALMVSQQLLPCFLIFNNRNLNEFLLLYFSKFISFFVIEFILQIGINKFCIKLQEIKEDSKLAKVFYDWVEEDVTIRNNETSYQKALSYSMLTVSLVSSIILYPALAIFVYYTQQSTQIASTLMIKDHSLLVPTIFFLVIGPVELYIVLLLIEYLKKEQGIRIEQTIKFNHFKFMRVKFRWINDVLAHSKEIREEYREYQKFAFSSQLYYVITLIAVGMQLSFLGGLTMVERGYLTFYDPLTYPLFIFIWVIIEILSVAVSFLAVKFKLYEKKQTDLIRQRLGKTDKYLKVNEYEHYLQLDAVKDYFMLHNKEWIIHNLHNIFTKEDFRQNNGALFSKYKEYKSAFKRRQIEQKKKLKEQILEEHNNNKKQSLFESPYFIFRDRETFNNSKRITMYWYYLAKQNLYLKSIVNCVKKELMQPVCQFCKMDVELQVVEKKQFRELVNSYRVENVGRMFSQDSFLEYYRLNQEFITICLQCKEHNYHLQSKIDKKSIASKMMFYWLLMARSRLLHKNKKEQEVFQR